MAKVLQTKVGDQHDELSTAKLTLATKFRVWVMVPQGSTLTFGVVLLRFQNVSCRSVSVGFAEKTSIFGSV